MAEAPQIKQARPTAVCAHTHTHPSHRFALAFCSLNATATAHQIGMQCCTASSGVSSSQEEIRLRTEEKGEEALPHLGEEPRARPLRGLARGGFLAWRLAQALMQALPLFFPPRLGGVGCLAPEKRREVSSFHGIAACSAGLRHAEAQASPGAAHLCPRPGRCLRSETPSQSHMRWLPKPRLAHL